MLLPLLLIPVLYLVMIRPQQKRQKQWQQMLGSIKAGDRDVYKRQRIRSIWACWRMRRAQSPAWWRAPSMPGATTTR